MLMVAVVLWKVIMLNLVLMLLLRIMALQEMVILLLVGLQKVMVLMMAMDGLVGVALGTMLMVNMV